MAALKDPLRGESVEPEPPRPLERLAQLRAAERYQAAMVDYLEREDEAALEAAYEMGRWALEAGIGVLELAVIHHTALATLLEKHKDPERAVLLAGTVLLEAFSSFEVAHRGCRQANETLRFLNDRMEEESKRIAISLHGEAGQMLSAVHIALAGLEMEMRPEARAPVQRIREMLDAVEGQLRHLSHELRPALLDDLGLEPAIRFHAEGVAARSQLRVLISGSTEGRHPVPVETVLYRVVQEALRNIVRHARASEATVLVRRDSDGLRCFVADNGIGFAPRSMRKGERGMGLPTLRDRLALLGGSLEIRSGEDACGSVVIAFVPLPLVENDSTGSR